MTLSEGAIPKKARSAALEFDALARELVERFSVGVESPWSDAEFSALALRVFAHQFAHNPMYRRYSERRGATPNTVRAWQDVPLVPTGAFRHLDLVAGEVDAVEAVFHTSGTSSRGHAPGRHLIPRLSLYSASLRPPFKAHLLPDSDELHFISLIPSPAELPRSSLSYMVGAAAEAFASDVHWVVDGAGVINRDLLAGAVRDSGREGRAVLLLGTAFAFVHALEQDALGSLPPGSRIMETGGFKGRSREVTSFELYEALSSSTTVALDHIVNEYGMTELQSQLYTPVMSEHADAGDSHVFPPWMRVRALDPLTLEELEEGGEGLLAFFDLANAGSVCHVLTEDVGSVGSGRVRLGGRVVGAEPRGCSRAMDDLMAAAGDSR
jgi:hypothetical protein